MMHDGDPGSVKVGREFADPTARVSLEQVKDLPPSGIAQGIEHGCHVVHDGRHRATAGSHTPSVSSAGVATTAMT